MRQVVVGNLVVRVGVDLYSIGEVDSCFSCEMAQIKVGRTNKLYKGRIVDRFAYVAIGLSQDLIE